MLRDLLRQFNRMYAPHEAREDTVLFPALRRLVSKEEYAALGEDFEKKEHELFGGEGFEKMVDRVAAIEKDVGDLRSRAVHSESVSQSRTEVDSSVRCSC